jgi:hypothetical protein
MVLFADFDDFANSLDIESPAFHFGVDIANVAQNGPFVFFEPLYSFDKLLKLLSHDATFSAMYVHQTFSSKSKRAGIPEMQAQTTIDARQVPRKGTMKCLFEPGSVKVFGMIIPTIPFLGHYPDFELFNVWPATARLLWQLRQL